MLLEKLLNSDVKEFEEPSTRKFKSRRLQKALKSKEPVEITLQEIDQRLCNDFVSMQFDKKGKFDYKKGQRAKALMAVDGIKDLDLRDKNLMKHFGAETPADLAETLFGLELTAISDIILELCGLVQDEEEEIKEIDEIKN